MTPSASPLHVVIIDDNPDDRTEMRRLLLKGPARRYRFTEVGSGSDGVAAIRGGDGGVPDCVLLDYDLSDMTALDVLGEVSGPDGLPLCPVVVVTGADASALGRQVLRAGAQDYVGKDWMTPPALARALDNARERWTMQRELYAQQRELKQRAERDAFFLALSESMRSIADPQAIKQEAAQQLGRYLKASRAVYCEILPNGEVRVERGYVDGVPQIDGWYRLADYGDHLLEQLQSGRPLISGDLPNDPAYTAAQKAAYERLQLVATLIVPLLRDARVAAVLAVFQDRPRHWTPAEVSLVEQTAERTWQAVNRAQVEALLRLSQSRQAQLIDLMPSFTGVLRGPQHVFELCNGPYLQLVGRDASILGKTVLEALPELADQPFPALLDQVYRSGESYEASSMLARLARQPGGALEDRFVDFTYTALREADGSVSGVLIHGHDRTDQVYAERALRQSQRELQNLTDNTPDILTRFDPQLRHVFVSKAIEKATGRSASELIGKTNRELGMPLHLCDQWDAAVRQVLETAQAVVLEFEFEGPQQMSHYAARLVPEFGTDQEVVHVLAVTHDVTEQKQAENALRQADRRKDEFLATLAHELRNPLAPISTGLALLRLGVAPEKQRQTVAMMERQMTQIVKLVDDLLEVSRFSLDKVELSLERLGIGEAIDAAVEACAPIIEAQDHQLRVEVQGDGLVVNADKTRLAQIIANLLTNAAKYSEPHSLIRIVAERDGDHAVIHVHDQGVGISAEALPALWNMFAQVRDTLDKAQGGLGIGLSLVKKLVELHGGSVSAASDGIGRGSTFSVRLPLAPVDAGIRALNSAAATPAADALSRRVLVVDDSEDIASSLAELVQASGHEAITANDGPSALERMRAFLPEVILLDIGMPGMNGYDVARQVRADARCCGALLVAMTGWGSEHDKQRSKAAGFDLHLTKPVDLVALEALLVNGAPPR